MRYTVKDTHIRHNDRTYVPGSVVELTEEEAGPLLHHLEPAGDATGPAGNEDSVEEKKGRRK